MTTTTDSKTSPPSPSPHLMSERRRPSFHIDTSSDEEEEPEVGSPGSDSLILNNHNDNNHHNNLSSPTNNKPSTINHALNSNPSPIISASSSSSSPPYSHKPPPISLVSRRRSSELKTVSTSPTATYMQQQRVPSAHNPHLQQQQQQQLQQHPHLAGFGSYTQLSALLQQHQPTPMSSELVQRFTSQSLHSFSFAFISQNAISSRLDILKRSLEFLRDNPALTSMSNFPSTSSTTALEDFFKSPIPSRTQLRSSASSAALSMLANYPAMGAAGLASSANLLASASSASSAGSLNTPSTAAPMARGATTANATSSAHAFLGEPSNTLFDNNLKSILTLLENAHVFPASGPSPSIENSSSNSKLYSVLAATKNNSNNNNNNNNSQQQQQQQQQQQPTPFKPITNDESIVADTTAPALPQLPNHTPKHLSPSPSKKKQSSLLEPLKFRKRTKTNIATFHLQAQLLDALATPYYDPYWTNLIQRTGTVSSMPTISTSASTVDLKSAGLRNPSMFSSASSILHPISSRFSSNQAVFTTSSEEPYRILASNDISCLVFGMSKLEIRRQTISDIVGTNFREGVIERARNCPPNTTFFCGELVPIVKCTGQSGLASFFAKKHNSGIIAWVIEEIAHDRANLTVNLTNGSLSVSGPQKHVLFPSDNDENLNIRDTFSGIPEDLRVMANNLRNNKRHVENHVTVSGNTIVPTMLQIADDDKPDQDDGNILSLQLVSIPHMAGIILLDPEHMTIAGYNASVVEQLFGYPETDTKHCVGWSIDELIPNFTAYVERIERTCDLNLRGRMHQGLVVPEHLFRKAAVEIQMEQQPKSQSGSEVDSPLGSETVTARASPVSTEESSDQESGDELAELPSHLPNGHIAPALASSSNLHQRFALSDGGGFMPKKQLDTISAFMDSKGIEALHRDGISLTVDVQMRIIGDGNAALWVTYSRNITGQQESNQIPSQFTLFSMKNKAAASIKKSSSSRSINGRHSNSSTQSDQSSGSSSFSSLSEPAASNESLAKLANGQPLTPSQSHQDEKPVTPESKPVSQSSNDSTVTTTATTETTTTAATTVTTSTPRAQIISQSSSDTPNSASSAYSIHIPELGARRREKTLADFKILKRMGEGAYGKVILAEYACEPPLRVILKSVIKERILVDTWTRDRKLGTIPSEIKVMAVLTKWPHDNIVQLLDFFEDEEYFHIEMEPHGNPGTDLFDLIENQPDMPESQCRNLFKQVVSAVRHLHSHDIVHRDIKDENVIVDGSGLVKLIDFGSSAFVRQGPFDVFVGTLDYAAPEVLAGKPYEGKPQDVWALGILLYTIIYKENPFYNVDEIMDHDLRVPFVMSEPCIDLIRMILTRPVRKRPSVEDIWNHPWIQA
ncbi:uncharacterized protein SAPINGB_P004968 [Magnusiomyces paraingens]|uniref:non-specific serine/threonine protein kinase n=1 Tax=Magnusiomyces paraingens TaxID=2606893 RepID=A0A5E8BXX8_9ASCO|nr:uncharacterized protein SAPINGB_P004968 [Saprochaete ingens]VVT56324.1 unnamed protein product [Saprochaete ingens]